MNVITDTMWSDTRPARYAEKIPAGIEMTSAMTMASTMISSVTGRWVFSCELTEERVT